MGDCFPKCGGSIPISDACKLKTGVTEYGGNYKQWPEPVLSKSFAPGIDAGGQGAWKSRYSFSKGARFGIPPYCDCTPPPERFRFETTYQHDFFDLHHDNCNRQKPGFPGVKPCNPTVLPKQYLCPLTTETTYARAFDMPQAHFQPLCSQQQPCGGGCGGGGCGDPCDNEECFDPCGINIRFQPEQKRRCIPKLRKEDLIKPGTDTSDCCACPVEIPCCPCDDASKLCDACCGCEYPCKLHMAATTPTRKYPIILNTPRYIPDPRDPPRRPLLLCSGGTLECPLQNQFPTQAAIAQAKQRLLDKLEEERCKFPPECIESTYRSTYKTPPLTDVPTYCSLEMKETARQANEEYMSKDLPPSCIPPYCMEGGRPPDPRPMFDHFSTYQADYVWNQMRPFKLLGGEFPCKFEIRPLCTPRVIHASEVIKQRTEEKERWGENWECCPEPAC